MRLFNRLMITIAVSVFTLIAILIFFYYTLQPEQKITEQNYIAHAGGAIDGHNYTNSLEAVENAIKNGIHFIELDLALTEDSVLVCTHDWNTFGKQTGCNNAGTPLLYSEYKTKRLYGSYIPMTMELIDSIWTVHPDLYLVTDKISDWKLIERYLGHLKHRMIVECFTFQDYMMLKEKGYFLPMYSLKSKYSVLLRLILGKMMNRCFDSMNMFFVGSCQEHTYSSSIFEDKTRFYPCAIYNIENGSKQEADEYFSQHPEAKFIYIDTFE